jgi:hypothetical protein
MDRTSEADLLAGGQKSALDKSGPPNGSFAPMPVTAPSLFLT